MAVSHDPHFEHEKWSSEAVFLLAAIGGAVGLAPELGRIGKVGSSAMAQRAGNTIDFGSGGFELASLRC